MFYNFRTCYSTVSNMRRYGHKCHFRIIIFSSTFSLSSQYLIQRFLSLFIVFSLSNPCSLSLSSSNHSPSPSTQRYGGLTDKAVESFYVCHRSTVWWPHRSMVCHYSTTLSGILIALSPRRSRHINLGFVGLCRWMWMWVCVSSGCGFLLISLVMLFLFLYFFLRWHWWMWVCVGGGRCCGNGGCAVVVVVDDEDEDDRE